MDATTNGTLYEGLKLVQDFTVNLQLNTYMVQQAVTLYNIRYLGGLGLTHIKLYNIIGKQQAFQVRHNNIIYNWSLVIN